MSFSKRCVILLVIAGLQSACGGGGDGQPSTGSSASSASSISTAPPSAPPPPTISYSGASGAANLTNENVGAMADSLMASVYVALDISDSFTNAPVTPGSSIDRTAVGPLGGSVHFTGYTLPDGTGWIAAELNAYQNNTGTFDGMQVIETLQLPSVTNGQVTRNRLSLHSFRVRTKNIDFTYSGSITQDGFGGTANKNVTGSIQITENPSGISFYGQNINITRNQAADGTRSLIATARAFDSRYGYVDVQSDGPWYFKRDEFIPHHGDGFRGIGASGRYLKLSPLTPSIVGLEYVSAGATKLDRSARLTWQQSFERQTSQQPLESPVADAGASRYEKPGTTVVMDARFSTHPQTAILNYQWRLVFRPVGSSAVIVEPQINQPRITLDVEGRYLIEVTANDGIHTARDMIVLTADANMTPTATPATALLTPDESTGTQNFFVDLSLTTRTSFDEFVPSVATDGISLSGGALTLSSGVSTSANVSFTQSGVYEIIRSEGGMSSSTFKPLDIKWIAYNSPMPFTPAAISRLPGTDTGGIAAGDLNGDGTDDIAVATIESPGVGAIKLFYGNASGYLDEGPTFAAGDGGTLAVRDVNGDGRNDVVMATAAGLLVIPQTAPGVFGSVQTVAGNCYAGMGKRNIVIADLNGDNRLDVVLAGCYGELDYFLQSSAGVLQPPVRVSTGPVGSFAAGDFTGDGLADIAIATTGNANDYPVFIMPSIPNSLPGSRQAVPYQLSVLTVQAPQIAVADLNKDGRADIVVTEAPLQNGINRPRIVVIYQGFGGTFQAPISNTTSATIYKLAVADLNRDGFPDIATGGLGLNVFYGGIFGGQVTDLRPTASPFALYSFPETVLDINHDGLTDFAYVTYDGRRAWLAIALGWQK